jgi:C4-type Zn-finger protein
MVTPAKRPKGITCPACAVKLKTHRVIPLADGTVRRVRRCRQCGYKCSTSEHAPSHRR